jgi:hypothetical protein
MRGSKAPFGVVAALFLAGSLACSSASPRNNSETGGAGGSEDTGGSAGSTGGKSGTGGKTGTGGSSATGGSTGSTGGKSGSTGGTSGGDTGGAGGSTGGSSGGDTGGAGGSTGGSSGGDTGGAGGGTGGAGGMSGAVLSCWADPKVIHICHQLENACENCPPGGAPPKNTTATKCFDLVEKAYKGMATDADCAKFAVDNKCTVDNVATTGNVCGSLDCNPTTCGGKSGGKTCEEAKQWGDSTICNAFYTKCPCK